MKKHTHAKCPTGLLCLLAGLVALPANLLFADDVTDASEGPARAVATARARRTPRSVRLDLPATDLAAQLPALGPDDVVIDEGADLPVCGRVYELATQFDDAGRWVDLPEGGRLWRQTVESPNAAGLRIKFADMLMPQGAELIVYDADNPQEAYGPLYPAFTSPEEPYWTPTVWGSRATIEYFIPAESLLDPNARQPLQIQSVLQQFPEGGIENDAACRLDHTCYSSWDYIGKSVAHIRFISGGSSYICSGTMINRLPAFDATPYFLTASHCINTESEANSIEVYWLYETSSCNGTPPSLGSLPRTSGSTVLANDSDPDVTLLGLSPDDIPGGLVWAGWASGAVPNPTSGTSIHHPGGARKSISFGVFEGNDNNCSSPINLTYRFDLSDGGQEGGSSGGPVFDNANQRIRAVVSCSQTGCSPGENTWEGRFSDSYDRLVHFLNPPAATVYVNRYYGGTEEGTSTRPWDELSEGYFGVPGNGTIRVSPGTYSAYDFLGAKAMTIEAWGTGTVLIGN
ncbi:MAG: hypothetical protein GF398_00290 [Chitinivibrionales bacterium]|nr:hypothetical protein [Chitinivibrionales bacterium]